MKEQGKINSKLHKNPLFWSLILCLAAALASAVRLFRTSNLFQSNLSGLYYLEGKQTAVLAFLIPALTVFCTVSLAAFKERRKKQLMALILLVMSASFLFPWKENPCGLQSVLNDLHVWLEAAGVLLWSLMMTSSLFVSYWPAMISFCPSFLKKTAAGELLILVISILLCGLAGHICGAAQIFFLMASGTWLLFF